MRPRPDFALNRIACTGRLALLEFETRATIEGLFRSNIDSLAANIDGMELVEIRRQAPEMYYTSLWLTEFCRATYLSSSNFFAFKFGSNGPGHDATGEWGIDSKSARRLKADASGMWDYSEKFKNGIMNVYRSYSLEAPLVEWSLRQYREDVRWLIDENGFAVLYLLFGEPKA